MKPEYQPKSETRLPWGSNYIALNQEADQLIYQNSSEKFQFIQTPKVSNLAKESYKKEMKASMSKFKISSSHHPIKANSNWSSVIRSPETPLTGPFLRKLTEKSSYGNLSVQASITSKGRQSIAKSGPLNRVGSEKVIGKFAQTLQSLEQKKLKVQPSFVLEESKFSFNIPIGSFEDLPALDKKESLISRKFEQNIYEAHKQGNEGMVNINEISPSQKNHNTIEKEMFRLMNQTIEKNKIRQEFSLLPLYIKVSRFFLLASYQSVCISNYSGGAG